MHILFCNDRYPGRFGKIPSILAADPANKVMFLSFHPGKDDAPSRIVHVRLSIARDRERLARNKDTFVAEWEKMFSLGKQALRTFVHIREAGFTPDMIFTSLFDGPGLFLRHAFPKAWIVSYFNGFRSKTADDGRLRAVTDFQRTLIAQSDLYFVRSESQKRAFPPSLHPVIHLWPPYVDTDFFRPAPRDTALFFPGTDSDPGRELVTGHMKGTYDSQKKLIRVILDVLACRPFCLAALTFDNAASLQQWRQAIQALPARMSRRLFLAGGLDAVTYHRLLCSSSVYVFPEYESPPLQGMLETMSCETLLMSPVPKEGDGILLPGETMLPYPEENGQKQREAICRALDHAAEYAALKRRAREHIEKSCGEHIVFFEHLDFVMKAYGDSQKSKAFHACPGRHATAVAKHN